LNFPEELISLTSQPGAAAKKICDVVSTDGTIEAFLCLGLCPVLRLYLEDLMIRFTCKHCQGLVQVADTFVGKQGRCPFCKNSVRIPLQSDPLAKSDGGQAGNIENPATDDLRALKAAVLKEELPPPPSMPVPPPPQTLHQTEEFKLDLGDDESNRADEAPTIQTLRPTLVQPEKEPPPPHFIRPASPRFNLTWLVFAVGVIVILMAILLIILLASPRGT
jgi:hypothetical protein